MVSRLSKDSLTLASMAQRLEDIVQLRPRLLEELLLGLPSTLNWYPFFRIEGGRKSLGAVSALIHLLSRRTSFLPH